MVEHAHKGVTECQYRHPQVQESILARSESMGLKSTPGTPVRHGGKPVVLKAVLAQNEKILHSLAYSRFNRHKKWELFARNILNFCAWSWFARTVRNPFLESCNTESRTTEEFHILLK